jgi:type II secretory pathway predicted ATPase ExeA
MNTAIEIAKQQRRRLKAHFAFGKLPFHKTIWALQMFDSCSQRDLLAALHMWTELRGISLVTGPSGVGKSITLRRFVSELDDARFRIIDFSYLPTTVTGFLRSLCRALALPMRRHTADLFDAAKTHLATFEQEHGPHPIIIIDDAEGLSVEVADTLRRLTSYELDAEDRFSLLISGTEDVMKVLRHPRLDTWRSRVVYAHALRPFTNEDTRNYVRFHLERAEANPRLFTDDAVKRIFAASHGRPRLINQVATQALVEGAVRGIEEVDGDFIKNVVGAHPLYATS